MAQPFAQWTSRRPSCRSFRVADGAELGTSGAVTGNDASAAARVSGSGVMLTSCRQRRSRPQRLEAAREPGVELGGVPGREAAVRGPTRETGMDSCLTEIGHEPKRRREARDPAARAIHLSLVNGGAVPAERERTTVEAE